MRCAWKNNEEEENMFEREWVEENTLIEEIRKKKQKRHLLPNFSLSLQKKKISLTYYNRIPKLTTYLHTSYLE